MQFQLHFVIFSCSCVLYFAARLMFMSLSLMHFLEGQSCNAREVIFVDLFSMVSKDCINLSIDEVSNDV